MSSSTPASISYRDTLKVVISLLVNWNILYVFSHGLWFYHVEMPHHHDMERCKSLERYKSMYNYPDLGFFLKRHVVGWDRWKPVEVINYSSHTRSSAPACFNNPLKLLPIFTNTLHWYTLHVFSQGWLCYHVEII